MRERLPKPKIGRYGQIQEWAEDYEEVEPGHSHIAPVCPVSRESDSAQTNARASRRCSDLQGGPLTGAVTRLGRAWIINFWARLGEGELAYENVKALLAKSTLPNLFSNHPPFQIDGNFWHRWYRRNAPSEPCGEIELLPALPRVEVR